MQKHQQIGKLNLTAHEKDHTKWLSGTYSLNAKMIQFMKSNQYNTPHQQKNKNDMAISTDIEKVFNKIWHS